MICRDCLYFDNRDQAPEATIKYGFCRVNPPFPVKTDELPFFRHKGEWPRVCEDEWCGELRPRTEDAKKDFDLPDDMPTYTFSQVKE